MRHTDSKPSEKPPSPSFPDGVRVLHDCPDAAVDICFVHGLAGDWDRESTWTADGYCTLRVLGGYVDADRQLVVSCKCA